VKRDFVSKRPGNNACDQTIESWIRRRVTWELPGETETGSDGKQPAQGGPAGRIKTMCRGMG